MGNKTRDFSLYGMYNVSLPKYDPKNDRNLKYYFERSTVKKILSETLSAQNEEQTERSSRNAQIKKSRQRMQSIGTPMI